MRFTRGRLLVAKLPLCQDQSEYDDEWLFLQIAGEIRLPFPTIFFSTSVEKWMEGEVRTMVCSCADGMDQQLVEGGRFVFFWPFLLIFPEVLTGGRLARRLSLRSVWVGRELSSRLIFSILSLIHTFFSIFRTLLGMPHGRSTVL